MRRGHIWVVHLRVCACSACVRVCAVMRVWDDACVEARVGETRDNACVRARGRARASVCEPVG